MADKTAEKTAGKRPRRAAGDTAALEASQAAEPPAGRSGKSAPGNGRPAPSKPASSKPASKPAPSKPAPPEEASTPAPSRPAPSKKAGRKNQIVINFESTQLEILEGDITEIDTDAIVNAANEELQLGAGVAGAIREKGGPSIQEECNRIGHTAVGTAVMTGAGGLKARQVIHAVGPMMGEGDEDRKLASAVRASLALADRNSLRSIALPAISTGVFGFPMDKAARITLTEIHRYLQGGTKLERVVVVLFGDEAFETFRRELRRGFR
jgi:O-acetyl-ADP-ribose deacetylase (regulator of RNase III)